MYACWVFHVVSCHYWGVMLTLVPKHTLDNALSNFYHLLSYVLMPLCLRLFATSQFWTALHFTEHDAALCCRLGTGCGRMFTFTSICTRLGYLQNWHRFLVSGGLRTVFPTDIYRLCHVPPSMVPTERLLQHSL